MRGKLASRWFHNATRLAIATGCVVAAIVSLRHVIIRHGPGFNLEPVNTSHLIAIISAAIALAAFLAAHWANRANRQGSLRVEKSNAYLNLEINSSNVFKYEADHEQKLEPYRQTPRPPGTGARHLSSLPDAKFAYNLYFQTLNLFEVCTRFRRQEIIEHQVFASWVAWMYDTLDDWYFRYMWDDLRCNYTDDVRDIFDLGMAVFDRHGDADAAEQAETGAARKADFYRAVAAQMQCGEIASWIDRTEHRAVEPPGLHGPLGRRLVSLGLLPAPQPTRSRLDAS